MSNFLKHSSPFLYIYLISITTKPPCKNMKKILFICINACNYSTIFRAHLNDIENILPFIGLITIFAATGAGDAGCVNLISKVFTGARVIHTLVYLGEVSQPARGIAWAIGMMCNMYIGVKVLLHLY